jgi:sarcosine oxidase
VFLAELDGASFYGVPQHSARGLKAGVHDHSHSPIDPDRVDRRIHADDEDRVRDFIGRHLPAADGHTIASSVCLYTNSPDENFILDVHPTQPNVVIGAGFSGHGFKFASVVGEVLADLALDGGTRHDIEFLRLRRFAPQFMSH